ncbi:hypothetical protein [Mucilaginibacter ginkgonis]|uniref:Uncharacterized protein n=1 Tax=Mucilaginibacter ginkgonis TaxID=2682091 RepID=A0A6I4HXJ4_9SPHI|nr:hypothetical protein [Mucilaginibacter ginkgonis]QQL51088.1 hypothetical protein GO620_006460 [Mucilaginibacter ginkgonis]
MNVKHLETKNQEYRNLTLDGISVKALISGANASGSQNMAFENCLLKVILFRDGKSPFVICQDNLKILGLASNLNGLDQYAFSTDRSSGVTVDNGRKMVSFDVKFGGHINLKGNDYIYVEVINQNGLFTDASLLANSYLEVKPRKSVGVERYLAKIVTKTIQANETSNQYTLGDHTIKLALLNFDKADFAANVVNTLAFSSDRLDEVYNYPDLVAAKIRGFAKNLIPTSADISINFEEDQSFALIEFGQEFNAVGVEIQFNAANVVASQNYLVAWNYTTDWETINKANAIDQKHAKDAVEKVDAMTKTDKK